MASSGATQKCLPYLRIFSSDRLPKGVPGQRM